MTLSTWNTKRLGEIATIISGGTPSTDVNEYWNGNIGWVTPADLSNYKFRYIARGERNITEEGLSHSSACLLPENTVLLSSRAPIGYVAIAENEITTNQGFKNLLCRENKANFRFIYYWLSHNTESLKSFATGATFPELSSTRIKKIKALLPDVPTQTRIADILSAYDDLIENNLKRIALLEKAAQEIYKEWFVRFRFPGHETAEFENGLPKGWKVKRMNDFCFVTDGTHDTPKPLDDGIPLITGRFIKNGYVDFNEAYYISIEDHESIKKRSGLKTGDILFSNIGTVGNTCRVIYNREFSVKNVIIFKPNSDIVSNYLYYLLISPSAQDTFAAQTNGASQQFVGLTFMRRFKILVPSEDILNTFSERVGTIFKQKDNLFAQNQNLAKQRDLLLPRLMSGKLEV